MRPQQEIIRAFLQGSALDRDAFLTHPIVTDTVRRGLGPILLGLFHNGGPSECDGDLVDQLRGADLMARLYSTRSIEATIEIESCARREGLSVTLLKGISTSIALYPAPHLRPMGDLDLLIHEEAHPIFEELLKDRGFEPRSDYPPGFYRSHHHAMPLFHPDKHIWVELHTGLVRPTSPVAQDRVFSRENIHANLVSKTYDGLPLSHLRPELALIYYCTHLVDDTKWDRAVFAIIDLALLLRQHAEDFDWLIVNDWLRGSRTARYVAPLLSYLHRSGLANVSHLDEIASIAGDSPLDALRTRIIHALLARYVVGGVKFGGFQSESNISNVWRTLFDRGSSLKNLVQLPWNLLFPPDHPDRFHLAFQLSRVRSFFRSGSDRAA